MEDMEMETPPYDAAQFSHPSLQDSNNRQEPMEEGQIHEGIQEQPFYLHHNPHLDTSSVPL